jgi:hypothetical protein
VDFLPYEGAPLARGNEAKRLTVVVAITAFIIAGAGWLAVLTPVSNVNSVDEVMAETMSTPSLIVAPLPMVAPSMLANVASSDSDLGPGSAESELSFHPAAASKLSIHRVPAPKLTALGFANAKLAVAPVAAR